MAKEDREKITEVLDRYAAGWREEDAGLLKSLWDKLYEPSSYIAAEAEQPVFGKEAIGRYYDEALSLFPITGMKIDDVRISVLGETAHAFCNISIGFKVEGSEYLVHPRATFVLRKRESHWFVIHYHESIQYQVPQA